jgi:hypothetical protein
MMPHILKDNPFYDTKPDRTGDIGVVVVAEYWERNESGLYLVNFNPNPNGAWWCAPFDECQIEPAPIS